SGRRFVGAEHERRQRRIHVERAIYFEARGQPSARRGVGECRPEIGAKSSHLCEVQACPTVEKERTLWSANLACDLLLEELLRREDGVRPPHELELLVLVEEVWELNPAGHVRQSRPHEVFAPDPQRRGGRKVGGEVCAVGRGETLADLEVSLGSRLS